MLKYLLILLIPACASNPIDDINYKVNRVPYISDKENYGVANYKATPEEFYKNGGDCEDYANTKYYELKKLGITNMKFIWLNDKSHVMLLVNNKYVLDNQSNRIRNLRYVQNVYGDYRLYSPEIMRYVK